MAKKYISENGQGLEVWDKPSNATLFAHWTARSYQVTLNQNGATTEGQKSVTATYDSNIPTVTNLPSKTGYSFEGFRDSDKKVYISKNGIGTVWDKDSSYTLSSIWAANQYQINFSAYNSAKTYTTSAIAIYDQTVPTISELPSRNGEIFNGYYLRNEYVYKVSSTGNFNVTSITYGNGCYVFVINGLLYNGKTLNEKSLCIIENETTDEGNFDSVAYGNNIFIAIKRSIIGGIYVSNNGITWTQTVSFYGGYDLCFGNGVFAFVDGIRGVWHSTNGINWSLSMGGEADKHVWSTLNFGNGKFIATTFTNDFESSTRYIWYSTNAVNWTRCSTQSGKEWSSMTFGAGRFLMTNAEQKEVITSIDGITWELYNIPITDASIFKVIGFGNEEFYVSDGTNLWRTQDFLSWVVSPKFNSYSINCIKYYNNNVIFGTTGGIGYYDNFEKYYDSEGNGVKQMKITNDISLIATFS